MSQLTTYDAKFWDATKDPPELPLAQWLDEQVGEAVTDYVTKGDLEIDGDQVVFTASEPMDHLIVRHDLEECVRDYLSWNLDQTGKLDPESVDTVQRLRAALAAAIELIDQALP